MQSIKSAMQWGNTDGSRELLAQAKKANHTAIQKLYERYYTLLRSYSFVNGRFDEDLFQTQVIEFLIAVSKFRM